MKVRVKYLLWLAQKAGTNEEIVEIPENVTIADLLEKLAKTREGVSKALEEVLQGRSEIIVLYNSKTPPRGLSTTLKDGDIVTLMPPVSGGSDLNPSSL